MRRLLNIPLIVILMGVGALAMFVPVLHALVLRDWLSARSFFYSGTIFLFLTFLLSISTYDSRRPRNLTRNHLLALTLCFALLPAMLAVPFLEAAGGDVTFLDAYFEMVSSLTTTGATLFDDPAALAPSLHLWRALVGWLGGFFLWVAAIAILAPMNLGGFEVTAVGGIRQSEVALYSVDPRGLLLRYSRQFAPIYVGLTLALWLILVLLQADPFVAFCHAMSTLSTSGISPVGGIEGTLSGIPGEIFVLLFMGFALSRRTFTREIGEDGIKRLWRDPEFRLGLLFVVVVPALLFLRHWLGAEGRAAEGELIVALRALWGGVFTVLSFLTTTGFVAEDWTAAQDWSGVSTSGLVLLGLALTGGGVATTAGGVKLLRVYALYKHGMREIERLVNPSSVGGAGVVARQIRRQGAFVASVFFMLYTVSMAIVMTGLAMTGLSFEPALILTASALSTTGPLAEVAGEMPIAISAIGAAGKTILIGAMILGRLEMLVIIALVNPAFWRQ